MHPNFLVGEKENVIDPRAIDVRIDGAQKSKLVGNKKREEERGLGTMQTEEETPWKGRSQQRFSIKEESRTR